MSIIVIWSIAIDNIFQYENNLKNAIEKETIDWKINMSIRINSYYNWHWWTGLNSSYNFALLWEDTVLVWAVWKDFIFDDFIKENVTLNYIYKSQLLPSSHSQITKDSCWNQFSVFYPWAMEKADYLQLSTVSENLNYALITSTKKEAMFFYLEQLKEIWTKIFFDPGQQISTMNKEELDLIIRKANFLIINSHEFTLFKKISKLTAEEITNSFEKVIVTFWKNGSKILSKNWIIEIPAIQNENFIDDIWTGEAYRSWLIKAINEWLSWKTAWQVGTLLASFSLWYQGAQNHFINKKQFEMMYASEYKEYIKL